MLHLKGRDAHGRQLEEAANTCIQSATRVCVCVGGWMGVWVCGVSVCVWVGVGVGGCGYGWVKCPINVEDFKGFDKVTLIS